VGKVGGRAGGGLLVGSLLILDLFSAENCTTFWGSFSFDGSGLGGREVGGSGDCLWWHHRISQTNPHLELMMLFGPCGCLGRAVSRGRRPRRLASAAMAPPSHLSRQGGCTPLRLALMYGQLEIARLLLESKADVDATDNVSNGGLIGPLLLTSSPRHSLLCLTHPDAHFRSKPPPFHHFPPLRQF
jgi:hypothetical protein